MMETILLNENVAVNYRVSFFSVNKIRTQI